MLHADWLAHRAALTPSRLAIVEVDRGGSLTYGALDARATRAAHALRGLGIGQGDRVAIHARNRAEQIELLFACARLGAVLVPLNWRLAAPELGAILGDCAPALLLVDEPGAAKIAALPSSLRSAPELPLDGADGWSARVQAAPTTPVRRPALGADTPWLILYTSGSTGRPKGAILTWGTIGWNAINTVIGWGLSAADRTLTGAPLFHTGGWNVFTLPLLYVGGTVFLAEGFDPAQTLSLFARERITVTFGVPTMFQAMRELPAFARVDLSSLRFAISGGAPCPAPLNEAWLARGVEFKQGFGLTEVGPNCFTLPDGAGARSPGAVGVPMPHLSVRLVDEHDAPVAPGEVGELQLAGPTVCAGYWQQPEATAAALTPDGWFRTGDLFSIDPDGLYRCVGRRKEMFISGGENVYPAEVERVLGGIEGVAEAAVVPAPHPKWGEVGHAFLSFRGDQHPDAEGIRALCRGQLAGYKVPRHVTILPALPQGATGKIDKRALGERARDAVRESA
jgi:fatty-acyl-CoA synthase